MYNIGIIGCGKRVGNDLLPILLQNNGDFRIKAVCDPNVKGMKEKFKGMDVVIYTDADEMLANEKLDGVMIGTRCSLHTDFMVKVARYKIPTFLEKPVSISDEQLDKLIALTGIDDRVVVSFPLRYTNIVNTVRDIIRSGKIGKVAQVQAYNNVPYGRGYYHGWYRDEKETGGLWLQKATHDFDYINSIVGINPVQICAMESKQVFHGCVPEGTTCDSCQHRFDCPESAMNVETYGDRYKVQNGCCFAKDTGNHDSATAIVMYGNGMHAVYTQNFIARKGAGKRGARFIGYYGTVEFDFNTGEITVYYHNTDHVEKHIIPKTPGHSGGDKLLLKNFADVVRGTDKSKAPLSDGILSARMCLVAKRSSKKRRFLNI